VKGKCRPSRRRLRARGRAGYYEEELVAGLLRREERCDVRGNRETRKQQSRPRALFLSLSLSLSLCLSGNAAKPWRKAQGGEAVDESATRVYEHLAFPVKE